MKGIIGGIIATLLLLGFIMTFGWVDIKPTEVGVVVNKIQGKVEDMPLGVGYHFFNRWATDVITYNIAARAFPGDTQSNEESKQYSLDLKTNDGQNINVDLTIIYSLTSNDVPKLHAQIGHNYEDQIFLPQVKSEARIVIGSYSAEELYQGKVRDSIQLEIGKRLKDNLAKYPAICVQDALIRHFAFSPEFEKAIEQKKLAAQQVEINKNRALAQEEEAKRQEAEARGGKLKAVQEASGRAESAKIEADAQRYKLEQEAAGNLAIFKAEAEGRRLTSQALVGEGGKNFVALKWAENIPSKLQIWGIPTGSSSTSLMDMSGIFGKMFTSSGTSTEKTN